jgi:hypothetical protein
MDVLKSQDAYRPAKEWDTLPGLILKLKLADLALTEYKNFIEPMPDRQRLLMDFPSEVQNAATFELAMKKQGFEPAFVISICSKIDLNMTVLAGVLAGLVEESDAGAVPEAIRRVASQYLEGSRLNVPQVFVELFDRLLKMIPKVKKSVWEGLLESLCRFGAHNIIVETVLSNMLAYLGVLEEKTGQLDVAVFRDFPDLTTVDLVWVNKWLVDHVGQGLSNTLTYYHNLLREINWPDQTRYEGSFLVMNILAFLELTTNRFENYFDSKPLDDLFDADIRTDIFFFRENGFLVDGLFEWVATALDSVDPGDPDDPLQQSLRSYLANVTERYKICQERMEKPGWTRKF